MTPFASASFLKTIRSLHTRIGRQQTGWLLVEGPHPIEEALLADFKPVAFFHQPDWTLQSPVIQKAFSYSSDSWHVLPEKTLQRLSQTHSAPPVVAVFEQKSSTNPFVVPWQTIFPLCLGLDGLQDPGNVGTLLRSAVAFGVNCLFTTCVTADIWSPKVIRASAGAVFRLQCDTAFPDIARLCEAMDPPHIFATTSHQAACQPVRSYDQVDWKDGGLLLLGQEGQGLRLPTSFTKEVTWVHIPQEAAIESLNVAVSGAILLAEAYRQRT